MSHQTSQPPRPGRLFLIPTPLDFGTEPAADADEVLLSELLPRSTIGQAARITHWIAENAKSARAFLKRVDRIEPLAAPIQMQSIEVLPRLAHKKGDHRSADGQDSQARALLSAAMAGHDMGLVSEAGMPAIADPGSSIVRAAHALGIEVIPMVGPISLMLALAASGLNGQSFAFVGYVPQAPDERRQRLQELEQISRKTGQTQICIETPYRNQAWIQTAVQCLHPETRLAVCYGLTIPAEQQCTSLTVSQWRSRLGKNPTEAEMKKQVPSTPAVFLFGA